ncbi:3-deoxy-D-manno-octulosonic acid kinase [uncultured Pseudoalteromonas sp.]|uniref:3-deoxy-D-manno-octulosonic acid kinase n=1 Tax=uncultured Pseudoalteromonas sp. TaxID=114053 RepID=UPI000C6A5F9F|nr:3-deoxy-D-manno-octulosonic acid kinase [uncultured Pseudoalteromonas sp.]MBD55854.1 3-deoxy-D-manno-octulosonic acid kinase [Pseudoalteromonas sp.]|tara:strand:- start:5928 stop:6650 length:723 start_codon:yes stop_codon:yes gene_type:complete
MFETQYLQNTTLLCHPDYKDELTQQWFDASYWQQQEKIVGAKKGRATAWFFKHQQLTGVLRHYWRGGLVGKLLSDQYLYFGLKQTRVYKEFTLMMRLRELGLNVPTPIGAKIKTSGFIYRGDIITEAVTGAKSVLDILITRPLSHSELKAIAATLSDFHNHGVYHADLNINNILFDDTGKVFIIDFDRGEIKKPHPSWQTENIKRLARSFAKEQGRNEQMHWRQSDWQSLICDYQALLKT